MQERLKQLEEKVTQLETNWLNLSDYGAIPITVVNAIKAHLPNLLFGSATIDFGSVSAGASTSSSIPVQGAKPGDVVALGIPGPVGNNDLLFLAFVGSANLVSISLTNTHASNSVDPASGVYTAVVFKK